MLYGILAAAAVAAAVIPPAGELPAAVGGEVHGRIRLNDYSIHGALRAGAAQDSGLAGGDHRAKCSILPVRLNLCGLLRNFFILARRFHCLQTGQHPVSVVVGVLDNRRSVRLIVVVGLAETTLDLVPDLHKAGLSFAAAISRLGLGRVEALHHGNLGGVKSLLGLIAQVTDGIIHAVEALHDVHAKAVDGVLHGVEAIAQALGHAAHSVFQAVEVELTAQVGAGQGTVCSGHHAAVAPAAHAAPHPAAKAAEEHGEQEQHNHGNQPVTAEAAAPAVAAVAVVPVGHSGDIRHGQAVFRTKRHIQFSFVDVFLKMRPHFLDLTAKRFCDNIKKHLWQSTMPRTSVISQDTELPLGVFPLSSRKHAHHALGNLLRRAVELVDLLLTDTAGIDFFL